MEISKKITLPFQVITMFLFSTNLTAQSFEYGLTLNYLNVEGQTLSEKNTLIDVNGSSVFAGPGFGVNIPFYSFTDELSIGMLVSTYPGLMVASGTSNGGPGDSGASILVPGYFTLRYGAGSNKRSELPVGIGVGFGFQYLGYIVDVVNSNPEDDGLYGFIKPSIFFEIALNYPRLKLRIEKPLGKMTRTYQTEQEIREYLGPDNIFYTSETAIVDYGYKFNQISVSLIAYTNF